MRIVNPSATIETRLDTDEVYTTIERFGRTAYKSEDKITPTSAKARIHRLSSINRESS